MQKMDVEIFIQILPSTLKEELLFHQYGKHVVKDFDFLSKLGNNDFVWAIIRRMFSIKY